MRLNSQTSVILKSRFAIISNAHTKAIEAKAKLLAEENPIMLADLSIIDHVQKALVREEASHHPTT
jgi:hypothetical protein